MVLDSDGSGWVFIAWKNVRSASGLRPESEEARGLKG